MKLSFPAPFFGSFFDFVELDPLKWVSVGRAKNEQMNRGQAEKQEPQNYLQP